MRIPLGVLALVALALLAFYLLEPPPGSDGLAQRTDLPWQIATFPDGSSRVFDLDLGRATLADAMAKFGALQGLAVFEPGDGPLALEGYFGSVRFGPLQAKVIVALEADRATLQTLRTRGSGREGSPSGAWKYPLRDDPTRHAQRRLTGITFVPSTRDLDAAFVRARFGEPAAWRHDSERAVTWFYPALGLTVLIDDDAHEVLEYRPPRDFETPDDVTPNPAVR